MAKRQTITSTVGEVATALDTIAPPNMAQSWDNVGLLVGDKSARCRQLLLCIDLTPAVLAEAVANQCEMILAYHPPIFRAIKHLRADSDETDAIVHDAIKAGIAIYSPHTALDAAPGGTNDVLAGLCGLTDVEPFEYTSQDGSQCKVVTFVPAEKIDAVSFAMAAAGAGRIGAYDLCSYRIAGEGTFFGTESTNPRVGRKGRLEKVPEIRVEMIAPRSRLPEVINALLRTHPYEEPAYDIYPLAATPSFGIGRVGTLPARTTLAALAAVLTSRTGSNVTTVVGKPNTRLQCAAICVGAAGLLPLEKPRSARCDVVVTGELRHHEALKLQRMGKTAIALGHWESERPVLPVLVSRLARMVPGLRVKVSRKDAPPFTQA
jgi:dinuclear metal center YbgI/SA1388 family protein